MGPFPNYRRNLDGFLLHPLFEAAAFFVFICLSFYFIWSVPAFVTMDGPAHLYNASLLNQFESSTLLQDFYIRNSGFLPNSFTHYLLAWLLKFFPPLVCEKIFISFF